MSSITGIQSEAVGYTTTPTIPQTVAGLQLHLSADTIVGLNDGDYVSTWTDQSGNANNATGLGASSTKPTYKTNIVNTKPVVRFTAASSQYFTIGSPITTSDYTIFAVVKKTATNVAVELLGGSAVQTCIDNYADGVCYLADNAGNICNFNTGHFTSFKIWTTKRWNNAESMTVNTTSYAGVGASGIHNTTFGWIGRLQSTYYGNFDLAELIIYNKELSNSEMTTIQNYLNAKYACY